MTYSAQLTLELLQLHEGLVCVLLCLLQVASLHGVHHSHLATKPDGVVTRALSSPAWPPALTPGTDQVDEHAHVLFGQPVEKVSRVAG